MSEDNYPEFTAFQREMIAYAKSVQGDNYVGDAYYTQSCWLDAFQDGCTAEEAVIDDMGYWEP